MGYKDGQTIDPTRLRPGHVSPETALVVNDYPYGYRLRTSIRYWIETTKFGDRFVSQTLNPKTDRWNKPKPSTYAGLMAMVAAADDHVSYISLSENDGLDWAATFVEAIGGAGALNESQRRRLAVIIGYEKVMTKVSFSVVNTSSWTEEQRAEARQTEARNQAILDRLIAQQATVAAQEMETPAAAATAAAP